MTTLTAATARPGRRRSRWHTVREFPFLALGLTICLAIVLAAIVGPLVSPYDPARQDLAALLQAPSTTHPLGTDDLGRDVLTRLLYGARTALLVATVACLGASAVGVLIGLIAGLVGGWTDSGLMRLMDTLYAFPGLVLAIAVIAMLGSGMAQAIFAISVVAIPRFARMMRAQTLRLRHQEYVVASRVCGAATPWIAVRHIMPNAIGVIIVQASAYAGAAVLAEASLSFLGLGVRPPTPAWGSMLRSGYQFLAIAPWLAIVPGLAISILVLGFNLTGDGLRDLLDPRRR